MGKELIIELLLSVKNSESMTSSLHFKKVDSRADVYMLVTK
jgi:hypothetical protein